MFYKTSRGEKPFEFERALCVVVTTWLPALRVAVVVLTTWATLLTVLLWSTLWCFWLIKTVKRNLALLVYLKDLNLNLVANSQDILDLLDTSLCNAGNMKQTVLARKELNKGAEWLKTNNATSVLLAYLWNLNNSLDALCSSLGSTVSTKLRRQRR